MAVSAGILLRKSQLLSHAVAAQRKSNALMRLVKLDSSNSTMEEAIDGIVKIAYSILDADRVSGMWRCFRVEKGMRGVPISFRICVAVVCFCQKQFWSNYIRDECKLKNGKQCLNTFSSFYACIILSLSSAHRCRSLLRRPLARRAVFHHFQGR
jgi:hypothetical protein